MNGALRAAELAPLPEGLAQKRVQALYRCDSAGRLVSTNCWDGRPAPRFFLMRTRNEILCRFRADVPEDLAAQLARLCRQEVTGADAKVLPAHHDRYLALLASQAPVESVWSGPAYLSQSVSNASADAVAIGEHNADLLRDNFPDWLPDVVPCQPFVAMVEDDRAVSLCASVRISKSVHCAGVETHPMHRRRGHAVRAVAAWSAAVQRLGAMPFYSTSWANIASQNVAGRLGLPLAGFDFHII